jgi:hypothetical protein
VGFLAIFVSYQLDEIKKSSNGLMRRDRLLELLVYARSVGVSGSG